MASTIKKKETTATAAKHICHVALLPTLGPIRPRLQLKTTFGGQGRYAVAMANFP